MIFPSMNQKKFYLFLSQLKETNATLGSFVDFNKVNQNTEKILIKLNQLNYLLGKDNLEESVYLLFEENKAVFEVLDILIAIRKGSNKKVINSLGEFVFISDYFKTPELVTEYIKETGLENIFKNKKITNLVDYVFGIEVGLDSNARKNRGGNNMSKAVSLLFDNANIKYSKEVSIQMFTELSNLGVDNKVFDFIIHHQNHTYLIETNFYNTGGSKLNEVARAYKDINNKIKPFENYSFVWITDGIGWTTAKNKLEEAYNSIEHVYNLTTINNLISLINQQ